MSGLRFSRDAGAMHMLWSDAGERVLDFSALLSGQVRSTSATGEESVVQAAALGLDEVPLLVEALD